MERLLMIDGSNLLFQMFFGMPARIVNAQGRPIQGTLGFTGALLKIIRQVNPSHMAVFFYGGHENPPPRLNPDYKSNRKDYSQVPEEENPFSQLMDIYAALDFMGIKHAETTVCETDDLIAGYALRYGGEMETVISSFDSDFFQLISDRVSVLRYRGKETVICTPEYIINKFGIAPGQYADFKSLTGDTADHLRGADGIGPKTASVLLREFGSLENILAGAERIGRPAVRESVIRNTQRLKTNYRLIRLEGHGNLPFAMDELAYSDTGITTGEVLRGIKLK